MAASCFSVPTTAPPNLNLNALPAVSSSFRTSSCRLSIVSPTSTSMSISVPPSYSMQLSHGLSAIAPALNRRKAFRITAVAQEGSQVAERVSQVPEDFSQAKQEDKEERETKIQSAPKGAKLYVGNLPRSCDNAQLTQIFQEFGTVEAVEVICNKDTGTSRGFAFVTMRTAEEANAAIDKLNGSDLGGRDMIVNTPAKLLTKKREGEGATDETDDNAFVETPFKVYVGNLAWSVKPDILKELFSQHGTVLGTRVLYDRKVKRSRVYGFVCVSSQSEVEAASASLDGKEFHGRKLVVREAKAKSEGLGGLDAKESFLAKLSPETEGQVATNEKEITSIDNACTVYVGNLSWTVKPESLKHLFNQHGNVLDARLLYDRTAERSRVYGFVCLSSRSEAESAIASLHEKKFQGRKLVVREAKVKS